MFRHEDLALFSTSFIRVQRCVAGLQGVSRNDFVSDRICHCGHTLRLGNEGRYHSLIQSAPIGGLAGVGRMPGRQVGCLAPDPVSVAKSIVAVPDRMKFRLPQEAR
jgi:hypothetical protein